MKTVPLWVYFVVPAIGYFAQSFVGGERLDLVSDLQWFVPNYLFYVAPFLVVFVVAKIVHARRMFMHVGLGAATLAFVAVWIAGAFFNPHGNALEWLWYWPGALIFVLVAIGAAVAWSAATSAKVST